MIVSFLLAAAAEEIVVTGERRARALDETPASLSVLNAEEILNVNADHPSELLARSAGVFIARGNGQEHLTAIRSPVLTGGAGAGSFLFLEDGVPLRPAPFANVNELFEADTEIAERIEIVKGPSGAVYGANAIHGVVNVINRTPSNAPAFLGEASVDTIARVKTRGFVSGPAGDHRLFVGLSVIHDPGYRDDSRADEQKLVLRDAFDVGSASILTTIAGYNLDQQSAGYVEGHNAYLDEALRRTNANPDAYRKARGVRAYSRIDVDLGGGANLSLTPYARWNDLDFILSFLPSKAREQDESWSFGAQNAFYLDRGSVSFIAGFDVEYAAATQSEVQSIPTIFSYTQGLHYDYKVSALSLSPFISTSIKLAPRLTATAASRLDYARYDYENRTASGIVGRFLRPASRIDEFTTASPKFSLLYDAGAASIYASYARGARPPQASDLYRLQINQAASPAEPETIDAFELGVKGERGFLRYDLAGYFMKKRNFFFRDADGFNVNDGRTRHLGAEAEISARLPAGFFLEGAGSYGRHTYRFSRPVLSLPKATEAIAFGADIDSAPRWLSDLTLRYAPEASPASAEIEWRHVGRYFTDAANTMSYPGHDLVNLRATWRLSSHVKASFALRNLLDKLYAGRADFAFGTERYFPGEERTAMVGIRIEG